MKGVPSGLPHSRPTLGCIGCARCIARIARGCCCDTSPLLAFQIHIAQLGRDKWPLLGYPNGVWVYIWASKRGWCPQQKGGAHPCSALVIASQVTHLQTRFLVLGLRMLRSSLTQSGSRRAKISNSSNKCHWQCQGGRIKQLRAGASGDSGAPKIVGLMVF